MAGSRGTGASKARSKRRAGIVEELGRRLAWLDEQMADRRARGAPPIDAQAAEASALREAIAIVGERTLPEEPPFPNASPGAVDEWRQLSAWSPGRQVGLLCDVIARLSRSYPPLSTTCADAFRAAHHAERTKGKAPKRTPMPSDTYAEDPLGGSWQ